MWWLWYYTVSSQLCRHLQVSSDLTQVVAFFSQSLSTDYIRASVWLMLWNHTENPAHIHHIPNYLYSALNTILFQYSCKNDACMILGGLVLNLYMITIVWNDSYCKLCCQPLFSWRWRDLCQNIRLCSRWRGHNTKLLITTGLRV